jgi:hypothetical protein
LLLWGQPDRHFLTMTVVTNREPSLHALPQPVTFDEFVAWYPENSEFWSYPNIFNNSASSITGMESFSALANLEPALSPATK